MAPAPGRKFPWPFFTAGPSSQMILPCSIVILGKSACIPSKGVHAALLWSSSPRIVFGFCVLIMMRSASFPVSRFPLWCGSSLKCFAGFRRVVSISRPRLILPCFAAVSRSGMSVSTPGTPGGASWIFASFSSMVCGAWSDAIMSMVFSLSAFHRAGWCSRSLSGGFVLP